MKFFLHPTEILQKVLKLFFYNLFYFYYLLNYYTFNFIKLINDKKINYILSLIKKSEPRFINFLRERIGSLTCLFINCLNSLDLFFKRTFSHIS